ncbi:hypothetical protein ACHHYP_05787 [Achlya hypogyna]|uniref:Uncharacterized protein n=1 Tax=Achlya hypogyna TaxID=1202772 RepID=A0A1V9YX60_ACHHY|nr:hypothetical protein ACHHYP_05787 [Achlya hypogyna]
MNQIINDAWSTVPNWMTHVSRIEIQAITSGYRLDGPPTIGPIKEKDFMRSTFVWPVNPRNVLATDFAQEPGTIALDLDADSDSDTEVEVPASTAALPVLPRPLCEVVTDQCRAHVVQPTPHTTAHLGYLVRSASAFTDKILESLLVRNAMALEGNEQNFNTTSWTMYEGRPSANWRFVADSILPKTDAQGRRRTVLADALSDATRQRIEARVRSLYDQPWQAHLNAPAYMGARQYE